jgi:hypothetical protein
MDDVLVACEESQEVTKALRNEGITAWSCDLLPCSGGFPEWHIQEDVRKLLKRNWGGIIAFPPCDHLAVSGARWFEAKRKDGRQQQAIAFFLEFTKVNCELVSIENPIGIMSTIYRKPDQIIQPWMFGHMEQKSTCLWLKGFPKLLPTNNVKNEMLKLPKNKRERVHYLPPTDDRSKLRAKTYPGVAEAMAKQWAIELNYM